MPEPEWVSRCCTRRRQSEEPARLPESCSASSAAVSSARCLSGDVATLAWENGFFMNGRAESSTAHARRPRFYEWVGRSDPVRACAALFFFPFSFFYEWGAGKELNP